MLISVFQINHAIRYPIRYLPGTYPVPNYLLCSYYVDKQGIIQSLLFSTDQSIHGSQGNAKEEEVVEVTGDVLIQQERWFLVPMMEVMQVVLIKMVLEFLVVLVQVVKPTLKLLIQLSIPYYFTTVWLKTWPIWRPQARPFWLTNFPQ